MQKDTCIALFSGKKKYKKNIINLPSAVFAQSVMKITFGYDIMPVNLLLHDTVYIVSYCISLNIFIS